MDIKDIAGLSEPASKLIEAFSKSTAVLYEPRRIRNEAKAQADALLIATSAELQADELRRRASERFFAEQVQKQQNLEAVLERTTKLLTAVPTEELEADWIKRFALEVQDVSDESLHALWARLLAGEFQNPGRYPRRLLRLLKDIDPADARMIEAIAPRILHAEENDGVVSGFVVARMIERWTLAPERGSASSSMSASRKTPCCGNMDSSNPIASFSNSPSRAISNPTKFN